MGRGSAAGARALVGPGRGQVVELAALGAVLTAAFAARLVVFAPVELGLDGFLSVGLARIPLGQLLDFSIRDVHPPLYYVGLKAWLALVGPALTTARWPSAACGALAIALIYVLVRGLWGRPAGLLAALLLALSPAHVFMAATVRDFAPGFALSLLTLYLALRALRRPAGPPLAPLAALAGVSALALYTWYLHVLYLAALAVYLLLRPASVAQPSTARRPPRQGSDGEGGVRTARPVLGALAAGGVAYLPWAVYAFPGLFAKLVGGITVSGQPRATLPLGVFAQSLGESLVGWIPGNAAPEALARLGAAYWLALALLGIALGLTRWKGDRAPFALALAGLAVCLPVVYALRSGWVGSDNPSRYLLALLPFGLLGQVGLVVAAGARRRWLALAAVLLLLLPAGADYARLRGLEPPPWAQDPALAAIREGGRPGDAVVFADLAHLGLYHLLDRHPLPTRLVQYAGSRFLWDDVPRRAPAVARELAGQYQRVWFVNGAPHQTGESDLVDSSLAATYYVAERRWVDPRVLLKLYVAGPRPALAPVDHPLGGQIRLSGAGVLLDEAGAALYVGLEWQALRPPDADYSVFVHVADAADRTLSQHDDWPGAGLHPTSRLTPGERVPDYHVLRLPVPAPSGEYQVRVGLYRGATRLSLPDGRSFVVVARLRSEGAKLALAPG